MARCIGEVLEESQRQVMGSSVGQLEDLGEALLDFSELVQLEVWLRELRQRVEEVLGRSNEQLGVVLRVAQPDLAGRVMGLSLVGLEESERAMALQASGEAITFSDVGSLANWLERRNRLFDSRC